MPTPPRDFFRASANLPGDRLKIGFRGRRRLGRPVRPRAMSPVRPKGLVPVPGTDNRSCSLEFSRVETMHVREFPEEHAPIQETTLEQRVDEGRPVGNDGGRGNWIKQPTD